ncbi:hypothetical protein Ddye_024148 [Dipteronia dyeriana]|uniref:Uncharacterized protein n=1 Tax=Dipteronia dyeriana TaxID=168575 RepID=A0AAD9TV68_9ROSI|nr:hypothetical protein Ddye_024148 [Dipteronia dyeriana]
MFHLIDICFMNDEWVLSTIEPTIMNSFLRVDMDLVLSIPLPRTGCSNQLTWHYDSVVKSGYKLAASLMSGQLLLARLSLIGGSVIGSLLSHQRLRFVCGTAVMIRCQL